MIYLYPPGTTSFEVGGLPLPSAVSDKLIEIENGRFDLEFRYPVEDERYLSIQRFSILLADSPMGPQAFYVSQINPKQGYIEVYAKHVFFLLGFNVISGISVSRTNAQTVLTALAGALQEKNPFSFYSDIEDPHTLNLGSVGAMEALAKDKHCIIGQWGGSLVRNNFRIELLKRRGRDTEYLVANRKNIHDLDFKQDFEVVTRLYLKKVIQEEDGTKRTITAVVDSPLINEYPQVFAQARETTDEDITTQEALIKYGQAIFKNQRPDLPSENFRITPTEDVKDYGLGIGDTVLCHYSDYGLDKRLTVCEYSYSPMAQKYHYIAFGSVQKSLMAQAKEAAQEVAEGEIAQVQYDIQKQLENANRVVEGKLQDIRTETLDAVELANAKAETIKLEVSQEVSQQIDGAKQELNTQITQLDQEIAASEAKAEQALSKATDLETVTGQVQEQLNQAKSDLVSLSTDSRNLLSWKAQADPKLTKVLTDAQTALDKASQLDGRLDIVEPVLDELGRQIGTKLTQADLSGYVTTTQLTAKAGEISREISRVEGLVPSNAIVNEIKSTADANTAKISDTQGNLNSITQTVNGLTTDMASVKDYVAKDGQRTTTFNQYVESKTAQALSTMRSEVSQGYVGKATLESTVNGINQTFSEIRGEIPTENGGTNLIIGSMTRDLISHQGATLTFTKGQAVSEWRATDAIRVRGTKGTNNIFAYLPAGRTNNTSILDRKYTYSIFIKNLGAPIQVTNNRGQVVDVGTNEAKRVVMTGVGNNASNLQINFQQPGTGQLDFYYWHPQIEVGTMVNDWSEAPEDGALNTATKIAEYKTTVDGQFANLSTKYAGKTEFQNVKTTTDLYERILGKTERDLQNNTSRIVMNSDLYLTEVKRMESNSELLSRVSDGESVTSDPEFANGLNGVAVYDNSSSGKITITREQNADGTVGQPTNLTSSRLKITHTGAGTPNLGGVKLNPSSIVYGPNVSFGVEISALLPNGYSLNLHSNTLGTGGAMKWLTSNVGTGKWERYVGYYQLGTGTINPYSLTFISVSGATPTTSSPLVWYIQKFDIKKLTASKIESMSTQVSQMASSYAIRLLLNSEKLLSELNLNPGGVKIKGDLIRLDGTVSMDDAFIKKAIVDTASVTTLSAFSAKIADLVAGNISAGKITSAMIASDAITAGQLVVDQALANKLAVNDLVANSLFSKSIFASKVQAVDISASRVKTGVLTATNGRMKVDLDLGTTSYFDYLGLKTSQTTDRGQEFWYGSRNVGYIGTVSKAGDSSKRGLVMNLETGGDFLSWGYRRNSSDANFTTILTLDPGGAFYKNTWDIANGGIYSDIDLIVRNNKALKTDYIRTAGYSNEARFSLMPITVNGSQMSAITASGGITGIMFNYDQMYFMINKRIYNMQHVVNALGLSTVAVLN